MHTIEHPEFFTPTSFYAKIPIIKWFFNNYVFTGSMDFPCMRNIYNLLHLILQVYINDVLKQTTLPPVMSQGAPLRVEGQDLQSGVHSSLFNHSAGVTKHCGAKADLYLFLFFCLQAVNGGLNRHLFFCHVIYTVRLLQSSQGWKIQSLCISLIWPLQRVFNFGSLRLLGRQRWGWRGDGGALSGLRTKA